MFKTPHKVANHRIISMSTWTTVISNIKSMILLIPRIQMLRLIKMLSTRAKKIQVILTTTQLMINAAGENLPSNLGVKVKSISISNVITTLQIAVAIAPTLISQLVTVSILKQSSQ